jgi:hypothetical protein
MRRFLLVGILAFAVPAYADVLQGRVVKIVDGDI